MGKLSIRTGRYALLVHFIAWFLLFSQLLRIILFIWQHGQVSQSLFDVIRTLLTGLFFDIGTIALISYPAVLYYTVFAGRWTGSLADRIVIWFFTALNVFILVFTFLAEITFWEEFRTRFNFIAVDYLIYTYEVIANIQESYPLPLLVSAVVIVTALVLFAFYRSRAFAAAFSRNTDIVKRVSILLLFTAAASFYITFISSSQAEWSANRYNSEISKSGIYSFFAAFRNNQMKYEQFYTSIENDRAFRIVKSKLADSTVSFATTGYSIHRSIKDAQSPLQRSNVVFILMESFSADFMAEFGNRQNLTPFLDSLAQKSVFFTNMYATGTRTVRGMEALTLCIPPTPGQSIVKRPENQDLYTISNVFSSKNYDCSFFYGGDGYFDNMNSYFGGNGFSIYDRGRGSVLSDRISTVRRNIADSEVTFENAWGICDEDIFNKMITTADQKHKQGKPFLNFVMTTSNHRPYTYPSGRIDIPSGTGREGAVKYADYALKRLFAEASKKPWYKNTVFIVVADHCASSAGKDEIDIANYHIPAFVVNMPQTASQKVDKQCSQIDLWPTVFSMFKWHYESDFFGRDILDPDFEQRAFLGTYRKLALMKGSRVMILSDQKKQAFYSWKKSDNSLSPLPMDRPFLEETIAWYQTADYLFTNKLLK
ncbi:MULTISPECIES: LTA synthase family protein [Flavobacterium]|uniref:Sulfatase n=1 Tax=Flavobacterium johnsoniae (strain ATCC 17061 / DSM 2064 / JCM 8514 / BCRC 14874 / CCUG 350202 / NBRC 14942 / NCIMB 11054 / UW101) TaxID=376686 RepID=A5FFE4_FLAJ1|nr:MULTISPECIES: alkaline phosphatase family protein [Flavobacterium]ABQ06071.1 sulfatase [Flavobacterium johnsoniae UW101]EJG02205.1 sulfatase [Flavobacterium sp. F52]OXG00561.1 sulfatase [Flavobacterium johnsoniae UW101]WQG81814.1 sulfatase-like hydrolase/transferase [Flavobacterium johnsoniae UW101]SHK64998.1 Phosphoglycerol transferase MdoB [Flavobacterium johnsoniae]